MTDRIFQKCFLKFIFQKTLFPNLLKKSGYKPVNATAVIMAEKPKLARYTAEMRKNLAAAACEKMEDGKLLVRQRNTLAGLCNGMLEQIDFDILALGEDHKGERFDIATKWCEEHGKKVVRLKRTPGISSSQIKSGLQNEKK